MRITKWFKVLTVLMLVGSLMVGCGGSSEPTSTPTVSPGSTSADTAPPFDESTPVEIQYWHIFSDGSMKELTDKLVAEFEAQHPNIKVKQLGVSFWDYWTKLSTAVAGGSGPDLAMQDTSTAISRAANGVIVNVSPYMKRDGIMQEDYFQVIVDRLKYKDNLYAMPLDTDVRVLYYNKDLFTLAGLDPNKPPVNWAEAEQYADKLTILNDKGLIKQVGFLPSSGNLGFHTLAWTNGGDFWDDQMNPTFNKPENVEALEWMVKMQQKYTKKALAAFAVQSGALTYSPFIAGKVGMIVDTNNLISDIKKNKPDMNFGIAPIPYQKSQASWSAGFDLEIIDNKDKLREQAAWQLMKFLTSKEVEMRVHREDGALVSNIAAATDPEFTSDPNWQIIVDQMKVSRYIEYVEAAPVWHGILSGAIGPALNGDISAKEAMDKAQAQMLTEIEKFKATQK